MISKLNTDNKVVGTKQVRRALIGEKAEIVYIAKDADKNVVDELVEACREKQIQIVYVETMKKLGEACKIEVNAAIAALLK